MATSPPRKEKRRITRDVGGLFRVLSPLVRLAEKCTIGLAFGRVKLTLGVSALRRAARVSHPPAPSHSVGF